MDIVNPDNIQSHTEWLRYFPYKSKIDYAKLKISGVGRYSISRSSQADQMSIHIADRLRQLHLGSPSTMAIVDATAGFGGNTLSFLRLFHNVVAIEKNPDHFQILRNNLAVYSHVESAALRLVNADFTHIYREIPGGVYFIDPPWNSDDEWYTRKKELMLFLSDVPVYQIVNHLFSLSCTKLVNIKVPYNFDFNLAIKRINNTLAIHVIPIHTYFLIQIFMKTQ